MSGTRVYVIVLTAAFVVMFCYYIFQGSPDNHLETNHFETNNPVDIREEEIFLADVDDDLEIAYNRMIGSTNEEEEVVGGVVEEEFVYERVTLRIEKVIQDGLGRNTACIKKDNGVITVTKRCDPGISICGKQVRMLGLIEQIKVLAEKYGHLLPDFPSKFVNMLDNPHPEIRGLCNTYNSKTAAAPHGKLEKGEGDLVIPQMIFGGKGALRWGGPKFDATNLTLAQYGRILNNVGVNNPPETDLLGWRGGVTSNCRKMLYRQTQRRTWKSDKFDIKFKTDYMYLEDQIKKFRFFLDIPGKGYSGRLPFLLYSGRAIFITNHPNGEFYTKDLIPFVHFIPVKRDMSDIEKQYDWAMENLDKVDGIVENATKFAFENFNIERAAEVWYEALKDVDEVNRMADCPNEVIPADQMNLNGKDTRCSNLEDLGIDLVWDW